MSRLLGGTEGCQHAAAKTAAAAGNPSAHCCARDVTVLQGTAAWAVRLQSPGT